MARVRRSDFSHVENIGGRGPEGKGKQRDSPSSFRLAELEVLWDMQMKMSRIHLDA